MSDYEFKNTHLAYLYDKFINNGPWSTVKSVDGMLDAFKTCDEALSELEDDREHWKTMYANACGDQDVLKESIRLLDTENRRLMAENKDQEKEINQRRKEEDGLYKTLDQLREENENLKKDSGYLTNSRDTWRSRAKHAEAEVEDLNKQVGRLNRAWEHLRDENEELKKKLTEANDILEETNRDRNDWRRRALMTKLTTKIS